MPDRDRFDVMVERLLKALNSLRDPSNAGIAIISIAQTIREECAARDKRIAELEAHVCDHSGCMESFGDPALWERAEKAEAERGKAVRKYAALAADLNASTDDCNDECTSWGHRADCKTYDVLRGVEQARDRALAERDAALVEVERKDSALREAAKALMPIISPSDRVKLAAALAEK